MSDPFQQFIMEVDTGKQAPAEDREGENEKLITVFQIVSSVLNLLAHFESSALTQIQESQAYLQKLADFLMTTIRDERSHTVKGSNVVQ